MPYTRRMSSHNVWIYGRFTTTPFLRPGSARLGPARARRLVLRGDVERDHEAVRPLVLERLVREAIGFHLVRHENETVVPRGAPIFQIVDDGRLGRVALHGAGQLNLAPLAAVELRGGVILRGGPLDRRVGADDERLPLHGVELAER